MNFAKIKQTELILKQGKKTMLKSQITRIEERLDNLAQELKRINEEKINYFANGDNNNEKNNSDNIDQPQIEYIDRASGDGYCIQDK